MFFNAIAVSIARMTVLSLPWPFWSRTRRSRKFTPGAIPTKLLLQFGQVELWPFEAMIPATCWPCPNWSGAGVLKAETAFADNGPSRPPSPPGPSRGRPRRPPGAGGPGGPGAGTEGVEAPRVDRKLAAAAALLVF